MSSSVRSITAADFMASGSSGRANAGSKGYDFASDDILCSYDDYDNQERSNGNHSDPVITTDSSKDLYRSRTGRSSSPFPPPTVYNQPEDSLNEAVISTVEKSMKKFSDNLLRFLEGISSRLSQLELYCYNLDKSIGEMRSELVRDNGDADIKLKSLEKHLQEVHRSVQILRDKQELAETQKELAKLSMSTNNSQSNEERSSPGAPSTDPKKPDNSSETPPNQQLALALPQQPVGPPPQPVGPPPQPSQNLPQQQSYYLPPTQLSNPPAPTQHQQIQYLPPDPRVGPQPTHPQGNQTAPGQPYPSQYQPQQQWAQQPQQQIRPPPPGPYSSYPPGQPSNNPSTMLETMPFSPVPQPGPSHVETMAYGYAGPSRAGPPQQQPLPPPQQIKGSFGNQGDGGYLSTGANPGFQPGSGYMMYDNERGRTHHSSQQPHYGQGGGGYGAPQTNPGPNHMVRNNMTIPQFGRNHPYNEVIEKLVSMGFRSDHVTSVIQVMEENGQPIDFNSVLDRLNVHPPPSSGPQRGGW